MNRREHDVIALINTRWLMIGLCKTWFFGYQIQRTYILRPKWHVCLLLIPGLMIQIGV